MPAVADRAFRMSAQRLILTEYVDICFMPDTPFRIKLIRPSCQDLPPVLCTPDDVILKRVHIATTIR